MSQHPPCRGTIVGMLAGVLLIAAGCRSDKPWPYSPSLGPEGPACFPCSLWGGYFPTCWDRWPPDAPKCPEGGTHCPPDAEPSAAPGLPTPDSPFTPEPTPAEKPGAGPKRPALPPAPDSPGKEESRMEIEGVKGPAVPKTPLLPEKPPQPPQSTEEPDEP